MKIEIDDVLFDDTEAVEPDAGPDQVMETGNLDARRRIERRLELKLLRELLDEPDFDISFD